MTVLLANASLGLRRRIDGATTNEHGERVQAGWGPLVDSAEQPFPDGRRNETSEGTWALALDPDLWPVRQGDLVIASDGASWVVNTSDLIQNAYDSYVDWVRVTAARRSNGGTEPGGAWFVARYSFEVDDTLPPGVTDPVIQMPGVWTGNGPPPDNDFGAREGDEYIDLLTGMVYRLGEE